jgi:hypothetical protein
VSDTPLERHCGSCAFYREVLSEQGSGHCHRYPPQVVVAPVFDAAFERQSGWEAQHLQPWVDDYDFCGEYERA